MTRLAPFIFVLILGNSCSFGEELSIASNETTSTSNVDKFELEFIASKLDHLQFRFSELFVQLQEQAVSFLIHLQRLDTDQLELNRVVERHERKIIQLVEGLEDTFGSNVSLISEQSRQILELQTICSNHDHIRKSLFDLRPKNVTWKPTAGPTAADVSAPVCPKSSEKSRMSGLCLMDIGGESTLVYKEQYRFGGDWLIVLQRFDGSENFNRTWADYRNGFGTVGQEYWLGLEKLHLLTRNGSCELLVEMETFEGYYSYAQIDKFSIGTEAEFYPLKELGKYSGNAGDTLRSHEGIKFSTSDKGPFAGTAASYSGGWWYDGDDKSHLTGKWQDDESWSSVTWYAYGPPGNVPLRFARMSIRQK